MHLIQGHFAFIHIVCLNDSFIPIYLKHLTIIKLIVCSSDRRRVLEFSSSFTPSRVFSVLSHCWQIHPPVTFVIVPPNRPHTLPLKFQGALVGWAPPRGAKPPSGHPEFTASCPLAPYQQSSASLCKLGITISCTQQTPTKDNRGPVLYIYSDNLQK